MLTEQQKRTITKMVYQILKESIFEVDNSTTSSSSEGGEDKRAKRESVMKWLRSDQSNHAALAYQLYGCENGDDIEQANARSLFTKKFQGHDAEGKSYEFDDDEITRLYNMKDAFIDSMNESRGLKEMAYNRKTKDEYQIWSNYGYGLEYECSAEDYAEAKQLLKDYRENSPEFYHTIKLRRVPI